MILIIGILLVEWSKLMTGRLQVMPGCGVAHFFQKKIGIHQHQITTL